MSFDATSTRSRVAVFCLALLVGLTFSALAQAEEEYTDVYRLGRSATRFSPDSAVEFAEFQKQFAHYRADYEKVLAIAGWDGNADALFAAVANAEEGSDGAVRFVNAEPGTILQWMALRRKGEPAMIENMRWAAKVPFPAWEVTVEDGDRRSVFVVPQWCMNLGLDREEKIEKKVVVATPPPPPPPPPPSPECHLSASVNEEGMIEINASGSKGEVELTGVTLPDGSSGDLSTVSAGGAGQWSMDSSESLGRNPGDYTFAFQATARLSGEEAACDTQVVVTKLKQEGRWIFRGYATGVIRNHSDVTTSFATIGDVQTEKLSIACGFGLGVGLEFMATERVGIDVRVQANQLDTALVADRSDAWDMGGDNFNYIPVTLAVNFHLTPDSFMDFYAGPMIGYASISNTTYPLFGSSVTYKWDADFGYGLQAGIDIPFGEGQWNFTSGLSFMFMEAEEETRDIEIDLDPATFMVGVGYRF